MLLYFYTKKKWNKVETTSREEKKYSEKDIQESDDDKKATFKWTHIYIFACMYVCVCVSVSEYFHWKFIDKKRKKKTSKKFDREKDAKLIFYFFLVRALIFFFISPLRFVVLIMLSSVTFTSIVGRWRMEATVYADCVWVWVCVCALCIAPHQKENGYENSALFNMHRPSRICKDNDKEFQCSRWFVSLCFSYATVLILISHSLTRWFFIISTLSMIHSSLLPFSSTCDKLSTFLLVWCLFYFGFIISAEFLHTYT